jgi:dUTP pyrophosphatase
VILEIKTSYGAQAPSRANPTDAGLDIYAFEDIVIQPGQVTMVDTGVAVKIPKWHVGLLFQRSSFTKYGISLANAVGVIDTDYRGTIKVAFRNHAEESGYVINKGDKIAQLVVMPIALPELRYFNGAESDWIDTKRGEGGFGSTGKQ